MLKSFTRLKNYFNNLREPVEYNLASYKGQLEKITNINLSSLRDEQLKDISQEIRKKACKGIPLDDLLVESFALVRETSRRVLGMAHFDVQILAAIALHQGKIVEMQTGEGKTLAAVMPAYLNALTGLGVHILTSNDYLAKRDAEWMGPVYEFLGLKTGYIQEGMTSLDKQHRYSSDITYLTAKESGFDYLRDFLVTKSAELIHRPFHYAIVDEADSIMIDEARIPLVIAGEVHENARSSISINGIINCLEPGVDYEIDLNERNVALTDSGLLKVEGKLGCGSLYDSQNLELLTRVNCELHARTLLLPDRDYLVKNGKVQLIDEFTGRIADKRHFPDNLQAALEAKEGLPQRKQGRILGTIAMQNFLRQYPKISGMTGTASAAAEEFRELYELDVLVVPTNQCCRRKDHPGVIYTSKKAKEEAIISEIMRAHETGQPVLVGTGCIEESERLALGLRKQGITCQVLNAKNDEIEAEIISKAGKFGTITVSTNMAGRGVDIKLGGAFEEERDKVVDLGGLYVIGTNLHESRRIDQQLRGRAGRQGDPGESRFFISLEDDLLRKVDIKSLISLKKYPKENGIILEPTVLREVARGQRIVEGYNSDLRRQLIKYSFILEHQRKIIHNRRLNILLDKEPLKLLAREAPRHYSELKLRVGENILNMAEKQITLYSINNCWADYLEEMAYIRESIHLVVIGRKNPLDEFNKMAIENFEKMLVRINSDVVSKFKEVEITVAGIDLDKEGLKVPSSTWTYLINENDNQFSRFPQLIRNAVDSIRRLK